MRSSSCSSAAPGPGSPNAEIDIEPLFRKRPRSSWPRPARCRTYGARPLKRSLQRLIENPLAVKLLEGAFAEGDTILVDALGRRARVEKAEVGRAGSAPSGQTASPAPSWDRTPGSTGERPALGCCLRPKLVPVLEWVRAPFNAVPANGLSRGD